MQADMVQYQAQQGVDSDFAADPNNVLLKFIAEINAASLFMSEYQIDDLKTTAQNLAGPSGTGGMMCVWTPDAGGNNINAQFHSSFANRCFGSIMSPCDSTGNGKAALHMRVTLQEVINALNADGNIIMRLQRAYENPATFQTLKLISQVPIEITIPVDFECTADDCIRVMSVVCASFAGIATDDFGHMTISCKVPPQMIYNKDVCVQNSRDSLGLDLADNLPSVVPDGTAMCAYHKGLGSGEDPADTSTWTQQDFNTYSPYVATRIGEAITQAWKTLIPIPAGVSRVGYLIMGGNVCQMAGRPQVMKCIRSQIYEAKYNLSLANNLPLASLTLPISVVFRSGGACPACEAVGSGQTPCGLACQACQSCSDYPTWPANPVGAGGYPFLLRRTIEYGEIVGDSTGYLQVSPDADGTTTEMFNEVITWKVYNGFDQNNDPVLVQEDAVGNTCAELAGSEDIVGGRPTKIFRCSQVVNAAQPGYTAEFSISLRLRAKSSSTGKVQNLQDDPAVESEPEAVNVKYVIEIGDSSVQVNNGDAVVIKEGSKALSTGKIIVVIGAVIIFVASLLGLAACFMIRKIGTNTYDKVQKRADLPMSPAVNPQKTVFEDV
jgi:hypothetical protein